MNILEKLQVIQTQLNVPKNRRNEFGNFKYRSCEDIQEAVKPLLKSTKTALTVGDEILVMGNRFYIKSTAILWDLESEQTMSNVAYAREEETKPKMDAAQVTGSASSYARKYALNGLFCIDDADDPDAQERAPENRTPQNDKNRGAGTQQNRNQPVQNQQMQNQRQYQNQQGQVQNQQSQPRQGKNQTQNQNSNNAGRNNSNASSRGSGGSNSRTIQQAPPNTLNQNEIAWMKEMIFYYGLTEQKVIARYGISNLTEMNRAEFDDFKNVIGKYKEKEENAKYEQRSFVG